MPLLPGSYGGTQFDQQFSDNDGVPLALGSLTFYVTGTVTPKNTYTTAQRNIANLNPLALNSAGRATFFLTSGGYDILLKDVLGNTVKTFLGVEDIGLTFLEGLGNLLSDGARDVTTSYSVLATDNLVTVDSSPGTVTVNLPPAATRSTTNNGSGLPLGIKNMGPNTVLVTPDGSETIDEATGAFTLPAASDPTFPAIWLMSDGVSNYYIVASHGLT